MTFEELKAAVRDLSNRTDLDPSVPLFVDMAEEEFKDLRVRQMVTRVSLSVSVAWADLPQDFLAERSATVDGEPLRFVTLEALEATWDDAKGRPQIYTIDAGKLRFYPEPGEAGSVEFTYYAKPPAFTADQGNWIAEQYPNAYRYGVMLAVGLKTRDAEAISMYRGLLDRTLAEIAARNTDRTGRPLRADPAFLQSTRR